MPRVAIGVVLVVVVAAVMVVVVVVVVRTIPISIVIGSIGAKHYVVVVALVVVVLLVVLMVYLGVHRYGSDGKGRVRHRCGRDRVRMQKGIHRRRIVGTYMVRREVRGRYAMLLHRVVTKERRRGLGLGLVAVRLLRVRLRYGKV